MKKTYARVDLYPPTKTKKQTEQEKIEHLYEMADKMGIKIGADDGERDKQRRGNVR